MCYLTASKYSRINVRDIKSHDNIISRDNATLSCIFHIFIGESHFRRVAGNVLHTGISLWVRCVRDRNACFIVSYNEAVIILFPYGGANANGGPIIPVIILIGALTSTIIISVEIQHTGEKERKNAEQFQLCSPTVLSFRYV